MLEHAQNVREVLRLTETDVYALIYHEREQVEIANFQEQEAVEESVQTDETRRELYKMGKT